MTIQLVFCGCFFFFLTFNVLITTAVGKIFYIISTLRLIVDFEKNKD